MLNNRRIREKCATEVKSKPDSEKVRLTSLEIGETEAKLRVLLKLSPRLPQMWLNRAPFHNIYLN